MPGCGGCGTRPPRLGANCPPEAGCWSPASWATYGRRSTFPEDARQVPAAPCPPRRPPCRPQEVSTVAASCARRTSLSGPTPARTVRLLAGRSQRDRRARQVLVVAEQLDLVVRRAGPVVVVEVDGDHVDRLAQPLLGAPQPRGRPFEGGRQVVVAEQDRPEGHIVDLVLRMVGSGQLGRQPGLVELQVHLVLTHVSEFRESMEVGQ